MRQIIMLCLFLLLLSGAGHLTAQEDTVILVTHDSFNVSEEVLVQFEEESGLTVQILTLGDAGTLVNQAVLSANNPLGDVLFGVDNTFLGRALEADIFLPYESPALDSVPEIFHTDEQRRVTPIDYGDVCLNYDVAYFAENDLPIPQSLEDLTTDTYRGLLVVQNPATSSPGLAFLLATVAYFGEDGDYTYLDFWQDLVDNDVNIVNDWETAYFGEFTRAGGDDPLVVSYASSPPVEVLFAEPPLEAGAPAPTGAITAPGTCFRQIEYAGILRGAQNEDGARQFIDFLLSESFQEDVPLQMFVFPVNENAELPELFTTYATLAEEPATLSFEDIDANREAWIEAWTETVRQ